ncbi:hypothetical protein O5169_28700, partial [Escherichia coli]|nr:hypothetical protein [Escherichia coli]
MAKKHASSIISLKTLIATPSISAMEEALDQSNADL